MRVVTFERNGARSYGILLDEHIVDVGSRLSSRYGDLRSVLAAGALGELQNAHKEGAPTVRVDEVELLLVTPISDLIFSVPVIVSYISKFTPLYPGDVISTGTPGGVGDRRDPPIYMKDGDIVEVEIDRIGLLRNIVQNDASAEY